MKNLNYKIQDWFEHPDFGVIVSIANPELDKLSNDQIRNIVGDRVVIQHTNSQEKKWAKVSEVEIANSIIDKKNVNICLGNSIKLSEIKPSSSIVLNLKLKNIEAIPNTLI
ncbi:MAG: hypothetical protein AAF208_05760 [Cyanobacteria bacterium P01_A01_bin.45]